MTEKSALLGKKTVILGVTGGIAAYKSADIVSRLVKQGFAVKVIMTKAACEFVAPLTFQALSANKVEVDMFAPIERFNIEHVSLAQQASLFVIAPATANVIAKLAHGIADDMLTAIYLASRAIKVICPAMNTGMWQSEVVAENLAILKSRGCIIMEPDTGRLACGDIGAGKMREPAEIVSQIVGLLTPNQDLAGLKILVTAGGTREQIDPVRFIGNRSSGKMGAAIVEAAMSRGASVTLIEANTTQEMYDAVVSRVPDFDVIIKAAAPADYRLALPLKEKLKGEKITLELTKNPDIAAKVGEIKGSRILVVFAAETKNLIENARAKLASKNADFVVANDVSADGAGFECDTNIVSFVDKDGVQEFPKMSKFDVAHRILDKINDIRSHR
jgi:phosphopantothenoylcysteine decarboxylase/phosphopantothenate--cysteine ligase